MVGLLDFVLGGLVPLAAAALAFAAAWRLTRRAGAAWSAGVVAGFAAGSYALDARDCGPALAALHLVRASDSHEWLPLVALAGTVPALAGAVVGRRWVEWLLAAPLCVAAPVLLLGRAYRASQQLREAGFADDAITPTGAACALAIIAAATLVAWALWKRAATAEIGLPRTHALLAILATIGAAAAAALTGVLVVGQQFGVLAAAIGGCAATGLMLGDRSGPEAARGPALLVFAGLLAAAVGYSELQVWQAAGLAFAFVAAVGWLPGETYARPLARRLLRGVLCIAPLGVVVGNAVATFVANEQEPADAESGDAGFDYFAPPPASAPAAAEAPTASSPSLSP